MNILVHHGGQQVGPYSLDEIRARLAAGHLLATDLAWIEGSPSWVPLSSLLHGGPPALPGAWPPGGYAVWQAPSSELAVTSLVLGVLSFLCLSIFAGIPAIICGHMARARAERAPAQFGGAGMALGGLILGYLSLAAPVLMIVLALGFPLLTMQQFGSGIQERTKAISRIEAIRSALERYENDTEAYPSTSDGLDALVHQPANVPGWKGPYLKEIPQDPWGHAHTYRCPGQQNPKSFDLISSGPDGRLGTSDDVNHGDEGRLGWELEDSKGK